MAIRKPKDKEQTGFDGSKLGHELVGLFSIFLGLLLILSLATFDSRDPWLNHVVSVSAPVHNKAGLFGSYISGMLFDLCGLAAWVVPAFFCLVGARRILSSAPWPWWRWMGMILAIIVISYAGAYQDANSLSLGKIAGQGSIAKHGGGLLGHALYLGLVSWLSTTGAWLIWFLCLLLSIQMLVGFSWISVAAGFASMILATGGKMVDDLSDAKKNRKEKLALTQGEDIDNSLIIESTVEKKDRHKNKDQTAPKIIYIKQKESVILKILDLLKGKKEEPENLPPIFSHDFDSGLDINTSPLDTDSHNEAAPTQGQEDNLPPWVLDFEADRHGVPENDEELRPDFTKVEGKTIPEPSAQQKDFFDLLKGDEEDNESDSLGGSEESFNIPIKKEASDSVMVDLPRAKNGTAQETAPHIALPSLDLLTAILPNSKTTPHSVLEEMGKALITCLNDFGIEGELVGITPGPVVTMFEVRPAPGVRVSRISNLSDDLALALKAVAVRIQAPVPGTDTVGIEIPNKIRETVCLKALFSSDVFQNSQSLLTLALGKDIAGNPAVADLGTMPHLLVAGATGAGKSVGINAIILSILYKAKPEEVRLLLIDPKRVEMAIYEDLPHLVHPVVTDMQLAKNALDWAVKEMEERYTLMAKAGVRNISGYNEKLQKMGDDRPEDLKDLEFMPYLVIIIDELADLMLIAAKEVETSIVRLAQLARAAGIHLILATQRPSVDVVTGLIKANFPCRLAFQVTSKHDSRTILDAVGAEHLLGRGDMLFKPSGGRFQRLHGAFVSDENVRQVVKYWKSLQEPNYGIDFADWGVPDLDELMGVPDAENDPLYNEAVEFVIEQDRASISLLQRRFRIGYNKAARLVDQMEQDGLVGPQDGSRPREILGRSN